MKKFMPEGGLMDTEKNKQSMATANDLRDAFYQGTILEARVTRCDNEHNLHVDLPCMRGIIERFETAIGIDDGSVRDIAIISRVNKPVMFRIIGFKTDFDGESVALLSRRDVQLECRDDYIAKLRPGDVIDTRVTHLENFGAFMDIGAGISALMPIDCMSISRIPHPNARLTVGQMARAVVKSIDESGRINLSMRELLGTWEQNAQELRAGETVPGIVRSVENYGIFIELAPNLAGLAEYVEGVVAGQHASVYIKSVIPEKMKIKLIIIDAFNAHYPLPPLKYFTHCEHIDRWVYSPESCEKLIDSVFE